MPNFLVISQDLHTTVVTNNHVVEGAGQLTVVYAQAGTAPATLIGTAPEFDIAVIKVDGPVPAVAPWGNSGELPLGASVIAIGSALGRYQNTVTAGILSGFNRELGGLQALLQTDAAINGKPIDDRNPLVSLLLEHVAGESITLDLVRNGQPLQAQLVLGERA